MRVFIRIKRRNKMHYIFYCVVSIFQNRGLVVAKISVFIGSFFLLLGFIFIQYTEKNHYMCKKCIIIIGLLHWNQVLKVK